MKLIDLTFEIVINEGTSNSGIPHDKRVSKYSSEYLNKVKEKYEGKLLKDFEKGADSGAYEYVKRQGQDFYKDFVKDMIRSKVEPFTDDKLKDIIKKYEGKLYNDFVIKEPSAYNYARTRGKEYLDDLTKNMVRDKRLPYTDDELRDIAKKFKTKDEFRLKGKGAHKSSVRRGPFITNPITGERKNTYGFYDSITSHMKNQKNLSKRMVYAHEFFDENDKPYAVYVGLTFDSEKREKQHITGKHNGVEKLTPVTTFLKNNPTYKHNYKKLSDYINAEDAAKLENFWEFEYFNNGWKILNVSKTGGLGGRFNYTDDYLIKKALKCDNYRDFVNKYKTTIYQTLYRRNQLDRVRELFAQREKQTNESNLSFKNTIIEMIQHDVEEIATKEKELVGKGAFHNVYPSNKNPNMVYKIGFDEDVNGWVDLFKSRPDIFPKVYGAGHVNIKLKKQVTNFSWRTGEFKPITYNPGDTVKVKYVAVERLNTEKAKQHWNSLANVVSTMSDKSLQTYLTSLGMDEELEEEFLSLGEKIKETGNDFIYEIFVELYNLIHSVYELKPVADVHVGNYGYDKDGNLKCLDI
jgi:hypothetical protein